MGSTWVASVSHLGGQYRMLLCAQGSTYLHVALEGPPLTADRVAAPDSSRLPEVGVRGANWSPQGRFSLGYGSLARRSSDRTLIYGVLPLPPEDVGKLSITVTDPNAVDLDSGADGDERLVFATEFGRHDGPLPGSDVWRPRIATPARGIRLLGAAEGRDLFYIFCEAPMPQPADTRRTGDPGEGLTYTLFFDDDEQQPPPEVVYPARLDGPLEHTVGLLLITVARRAVAPREFGLHLVDRATRTRVFDIEAHRH